MYNEHCTEDASRVRPRSHEDADVPQVEIDSVGQDVETRRELKLVVVPNDLIDFRSVAVSGAASRRARR